MRAELRPEDIAILRAAIRKRAQQILVPVREGVSKYDFEAIARPKQIPPGETYGETRSYSDRTDWRYWLLLWGRGGGKTRTGAETVRKQVRAGRRRHVAFVGATLDDVRKYQIEGRSGILTVSPIGERPRFIERHRMLEWPNGARGYIYTAEEPDRLRGPEHDLAWCDELASWKYPDATWSNLRFTMRATGPRGDRPQYIITTTPRPIPLVIKLAKDPHTVLVTATTHENEANLDPDFYEGLKEEYEGTRLGRQEMLAEILTDNPDALWKLAQIESMRVLTVPDLDRVVIGVDPAVTSKKTSDMTGIIGAGLVRQCYALPGCEGKTHGFVFNDSTGIYTPLEWAGCVAGLYDTNEADRVVAEINQGGELVEANLRSSHPHISYKGIHAARGVATRAEPVSSLYEQFKIHHVGNLAKLEDKMTSWNPKLQPHAPDAISGLVVALTELMLEDAVATYRRPTVSSPRRM